MTNRSDADLSSHFERLRTTEVPDVWARVAGEIDPVGAAAAPSRRESRRWLGVAAAALLVVGAIAGLVWASGEGDPAPVVDAPPTAPIDSTVDSTVATTVADAIPSTVPVSEFGSAVIEPELVVTGAQFGVIPSAVIQPICGDLLIVRDANTFDEVGVIIPRTDRYVAWNEAGFDDCLPAQSADPATYTVPDGLPLGTYVVCRTFALDEAGCGTLTVAEVVRLPEVSESATDPFGDASIEPVVTPAGFPVTLTPTGIVDLRCSLSGAVFAATSTPTAPELLGLVGLGDAGNWIPNGPDGIGDSACLRPPSSASATYRVPDELVPGDYILCRGSELEPAGCATFTVIALDDSVDPGAASITTVPLDVPVATDPPGRERVGPLADALRAAGVDVAAAPIDAVVHEGSTFCGAEDTGLLGWQSPNFDAAGRQCLLDHRMAGLRASFIHVGQTLWGDPVVRVFQTRVDGSVDMWVDGTRVRSNLGSGDDTLAVDGVSEWALFGCGRLAVPAEWVGAPATAFECVEPVERTIGI